jgi:hypothetical protein
MRASPAILSEATAFESNSLQKLVTSECVLLKTVLIESLSRTDAKTALPHYRYLYIYIGKGNTP